MRVFFVARTLVRCGIAVAPDRCLAGQAKAASECTIPRRRFPCHSDSDPCLTAAAAFIRILTILLALAAGAVSDAAEESISKLADATARCRRTCAGSRPSTRWVPRRHRPPKAGSRISPARLSDPSPNVRAAQHGADVGCVGPAAQDATAAVIRAVGDPDTHVRRMAILALEFDSPEPAGVTTALAEALEDSEPAVRIRRIRRA